MIGNMSEQQLEEWKKTLADSGAIYKTDEEYQEAFNNLVGFFDTLIRIDLDQKLEADTE